MRLVLVTAVLGSIISKACVNYCNTTTLQRCVTDGTLLKIDQYRFNNTQHSSLIFTVGEQRDKKPTVTFDID